MRSNAALAQGFRGHDKIQFGNFRLDPDRKVLWQNGQLLPLGPKVVHTLAVLVANCDEVVTKEELTREVWGDTVVEDNSIARNILLLRKALKEDPAGTFAIETIPRRGYRFCGAIENTQDRDAQSDSRSPKLIVLSKSSNKPRHQWIRLTLSSAALVCLAAASIYLTGYRLPARSARRSVAVIGFANLSHGSDSAWLSPALSEMIITELTAGGKLLMISEESVTRARAELKLDNHDGFSPSTLERLRQNLNADLVVSGAYTLLPSKDSPGKDTHVRLDLRIQDTASGETIDSISEVGEQSGLFDLVARMGKRVRQDLGARPVTAEELLQARLSVSSNPRALRLYAEGIERLRSFDAIGAHEFLQQAVQVDPKYALAHSALAEALNILGYHEQSIEESKMGFELSANLSLEQRLSIEGRYRMSAHDAKKAVEVYKRLLDLFPDNLDYGLQLASAEIAASKPRDALTTLASLRHLQPAAGGDPRTSLKEYEAWKAQGDFKRMEDALSEAADTARRQGALLLLARARSRQCWVQRVRREQDLALQSCREAQQIYSIAGDRRGQAEALRFLGDIVSSSDVQAAIHTYEQSLALEKQIGDIGGQAVMMTQLATEYSSQGDHATARTLYEKALSTFKELDDEESVIGLTINIGSELVAQGQLEQARRVNQDAIDSGARIGNKYIQALAKYNTAAIDQLEGNLDGAQKSYEEALAAFEELGNKEYDIGLTTSLGEVAMARGDFGTARTRYQRAMSMPQASEQKISTAETEMDLAQLALEEGKSAKGLEQSLRRIIEVFRGGNEISGNNAANDQAQALETLARCLLLEGRPAAALDTIKQAISLASKADPSIRLATAVTAARIRFAVRGHAPESHVLDNLRRTIAEAHKLGYLGVELEAKLALGEIQLKSGDQAAGRTTLSVVQRDASHRGFLLLARKAGATQV